MPEPDATRDKARLRSELRRRRRALGPAEQQAAARAVAGSIALLPAWAQARHIALYLAADGEVGTGDLERVGRDTGKQLYLPVIRDDDSLAFALWDTRATLQVNRYGIPEPPPASTYREARDLDIIVMPLVGWDRRGGRLGMGGGFYDRTLAGVTGPLLVGLAHSCQEVESLPLEAWDARLDYIATEAALLQRRG